MTIPLTLDTPLSGESLGRSCAVDSELLLARAAADGDETAFSEIFRCHQRRIWAICRSYLDPADAEDATQETFLKAWSRLGDFDGRSRLSTWLTRIAINTCLDGLRRRGRRPEGSSDRAEGCLLEKLETPEDPEHEAGLRQTVARLGVLESELSPRQREVFRLRFYAQLDLAEIASSLGVTLGTVKTQLHRAVHRIRGGLGSY